MQRVEQPAFQAGYSSGFESRLRYQKYMSDFEDDDEEREAFHEAYEYPDPDYYEPPEEEPMLKPPTKPQIIGKLAELLAEIDEFRVRKNNIDPYARTSHNSCDRDKAVKETEETTNGIASREAAIKAIKWVLTGEELKFE